MGVGKIQRTRELASNIHPYVLSWEVELRFFFNENINFIYTMDIVYKDYKEDEITE